MLRNIKPSLGQVKTALEAHRTQDAHQRAEDVFIVNSPTAQLPHKHFSTGMEAAA